MHQSHAPAAQCSQYMLTHHLAKVLAHTENLT